MSKNIYEMSNDEISEIIREVFYTNVKNKLKEKGISEDEMLHSLHMKKKTFWTYSQKINTPSLITVLKIATFFDIPMEELILPKELKQKTETISDFESQTTQMLLKIIEILERKKINEEKN